MGRNIYKLENGIKCHFIHNDRFKTNLLNISISTLITKENASKNALIIMMLRHVSNKYRTQRQLSIALDNLYGATMSGDIDVVGDYAVLRLSIEVINDKYVKDSNGELLKGALDVLFNIIYDPYITNNKFDEDVLKIEKNNLKSIINSKVDDKDNYAYNQAIETMYNKKGFGVYKYGYVEDVDNITSENLYQYYLELLEKAKINICVSGEFNEEIIKDYIEKNPLLIKNRRIDLEDSTNQEEFVEKAIYKTESMDVTQGKLVIGYSLEKDFNNLRAIGFVFDEILGSGANSMLFQNVREKAGLCYSIKSTYNNAKKAVFIRCGIDISNYEKALNLILEQLEKINVGEFTNEDLENAKISLISTLKMVEEEQSVEALFYLNQEINKKYFSIDEYINSINKVTKEDVINFSKALEMRVVYFLTSNGKKGE